MTHILHTGLKLQADQMNRALHNAKDTASLASKLPQPQTYAEATEMAQASLQRYTALNRKWADQWADWLSYASTLDGADTVPKFMERSGNIVLQAQAQLAEQISDVTNLNENVAVSYSYWISKQLNKDAP